MSGVLRLYVVQFHARIPSMKMVLSFVRASWGCCSSLFISSLFVGLYKGASTLDPTAWNRTAPRANN